MKTATSFVCFTEPGRSDSPSLRFVPKRPPPSPTPLQVPELKFERYKLDNGLEVILSEDHRLPLVAVDLWYHVGAANETAGRTGFAHLFEHMMFEGSKHVPGSSHAHYLESRRRLRFQRHDQL